MTRIFFASDLHGSDMCFRKFVNTGKIYKADVLICGGDLTGKFVVPIVKQSDGTYSLEYFGERKILKTASESESVKKTLEDIGSYPYQIEARAQLEELNANARAVEQLYTLLAKQRLERWIQFANDYLRNSGIKCFMNPGNDDSLEIDKVFNDSELVLNPEGKVVSLDKHHEMISTGYSNITPWKASRDVSEEELARKIEVMASQVKDMQSCIFNFHCPPYNSGLDTTPKIDEQLRPVIKLGAPEMTMAGSTAIRSAIEKYQPLLGLHGHIHESKGFVRLGRTFCINPGSEYGEKILRGAILNLDHEGLKSHMFVSG